MAFLPKNMEIIHVKLRHSRNQISLSGPIQLLYRYNLNVVTLIVVDDDGLAQSARYDSTDSTSSQCAHGHLNTVIVVSLCTFPPGNRTYTANVPALTGMALARVGPIPFQKPLMPSALHVWEKQSRIVLNF